MFAALRAGAVGYLLKDVVVGPAGGGGARRGPRRVGAPAVGGGEGGGPVRPAAGRRRRRRARSRWWCRCPNGSWRWCACSPAGAATGRSPAALFLAEGTVKNHVTNVLGKLGARDRTQAALRARALGLLCGSCRVMTRAMTSGTWHGTAGRRQTIAA